MKLFHLITSASFLLIAITPLAQAGNYTEAVLHDKPFAYYRLGEASNTLPVADEAGSNQGTFQRDPDVGVPGPIASDPKSKAVAFERAKCQYIQLTDFGKFGSGMTHGFTVEYWLKTADFSDHQTIFGTANGPGFITDFLSDIAYTGHIRLLRMYIRDNHEDRYEAEFYPVGGNINIYDNSWHHIVQAYAPKTGGQNNKIQFYVDGVRQTITLVHKGASRGNPMFSDFNHPVTLGAMDLRGKEPDHLEGSLAEVAFYKSTLSPEQIMNHYRASGVADHLRRP